MGINIEICLDLSPRQKQWMRAATVAGTVIASLGIGVALASPTDTSWIASGQPISASKLQGNLNDLQSQVTALETQVAAQERTEWVTIPEACSASPCAASSQSSGIMNVTRTQLGSYTVNFKTAFTSPPACHAQYVKALSNSFETHVSALPTTGSFSFAVYTDGAAGYTDSGFMVTCIGN